jgi:hypothetical protein
MKAIQFVAIVPRYVFVMAVGRIHRPASYGPLSCVQYRELPEPRLPGPQWVKVKTRYGGICASDVGMILAKDSPSLSRRAGGGL